MATLFQTARSDLSSIFKAYRSRRRTQSKRKNSIVNISTTVITSDKFASVIDASEILPSPKILVGQLPPTQQALVVASKGTYELRDSFPVPEITGPEEIMIKNYAVALNPIDWKSVDYNFCLPDFPWVTGRELAGVVEQVGEGVTKFKKGDRVWTSTYYKDIRAGCFQEYVVVPQHTVACIPEPLSFESASCLGVGALTAGMTLWKWLDVAMPSSEDTSPVTTLKDEYLLIWGGAAITGQFAIQFASKAGVKTIAVASERTKSLLQNLGADHVVTRDGKTDTDIVAEVRAIGGDKITRAIDLVGNKTAALCLEALSKTEPCLFAPLAFMSSGQEVPANVTVQTVEMKRFVLDETSHVYSTALNDMVASGELRLPELEILRGGLAVVEEGLARLKKGDASGKKLVVSMR